MRIRYHHLLCTSLYQGKGYSDEFNCHMTDIVRRLRKGLNIQVELVTEPDIICEHCPHRTKENRCGQNANQVEGKDEMLKEILLTQKDCAVMGYGEAQKNMICSLTEEIFDKCCGDCSWYRQGLCSYKKLKSLLSE